MSGLNRESARSTALDSAIASRSGVPTSTSDCIAASSFSASMPSPQWSTQASRCASRAAVCGSPGLRQAQISLRIAAPMPRSNQLP